MRVPFNMLMIGVLPLVIGLGVDDGIHVVKRMQEEDKPAPDVAAISVGRAITMTTITTCSSFAVTLFANHTGLESMGKIMLLGLLDLSINFGDDHSGLSYCMARKTTTT